MLSDVINIGARADNVDISPQFDAYSKVIIHIDNDTQVSVGNNTGRVFETDNPLGTAALAQDILDKLRGFRYQPYKADGALLDPAAEIGDGVNTLSSYGGIYTRSRNFDRLMKADISAPHDEEINHEYQFKSPQEREYKREIGNVRASLLIQTNLIKSEVEARENADNFMATRITETADAVITEATRAKGAEGTLSAALAVQASEIAAKVNASGGANTSGSFSWVLNASGHRWYANGNSTPIMEVTASGLTVRGKGIFNEGQIGGFDIGANALSYNGLTWGDTSKNYGAYIGQSGIQLGKNFSVDNSGAVKASSLTLKGNITFLNNDGTVAGTMSAADLRTGASQAYSNYGSWNGTTSYVSNNGSYWSGGAYGGYSFTNATRNGTGDYPSYFTCGYLRVTSGISMSGAVYTPRTTTISGTTIHYLGW